MASRFHARNPTSNRLQLFKRVWNGDEELWLTLGCDTIVVRNPLTLLGRGVFIEDRGVRERLAGCVQPSLQTLTIPDFNAGVIATPFEAARKFVPLSREYNASGSTTPPGNARGIG